MEMPILLAISILFAVANNMLLHGVKDKGLRGLGDTLFFNALVSAVWIVILLVMNKGFVISAQAWQWGMAYGTVMAAFLLCKMQAMATGPVSVTSFIGCSSLLIATAFGVVYFRERVSTVQLIGVALLLFALFLATVGAQSKADHQAKGSRSWPLWCVLFFVCSGATGIIFKLHQSSSVRNEIDGMMLAAAVTATVLFVLASLLVQRKADRSLPRVPRSAWLFVAACGVVSCGYNRLNIRLSGALPSILFFPAFNGAVILLSSLLAAILFREKINRRQAAGIAVGIAALVLVSGGV